MKYIEIYKDRSVWFLFSLTSLVKICLAWIWNLAQFFFLAPFDVMGRSMQREKQKSDTEIFCATKSNRADEILKTCEWKTWQASFLFSSHPPLTVFFVWMNY